MELAALLAAIAADASFPTSLPKLTGPDGSRLPGSSRKHVYVAGDYIVKDVVGRHVWQTDEHPRAIDAAKGKWNIPFRQDTIPTFPDGVHPPEQYVVGDWLVQRKYAPVFDPTKGASLSDKERAAVAWGATNLDLNLNNLGRDSEGRLVAFDW